MVAAWQAVRKTIYKYAIDTYRDGGYATTTKKQITKHGNCA